MVRGQPCCTLGAMAADVALIELRLEHAAVEQENTIDGSSRGTALPHLSARPSRPTAAREMDYA
jgi:hypothetical protein